MLDKPLRFALNLCSHLDLCALNNELLITENERESIRWFGSMVCGSYHIPGPAHLIYCLRISWDYGNLVTGVTNSIMVALALRANSKLVFVTIFNILDLEVKEMR